MKFYGLSLGALLLLICSLAYGGSEPARNDSTIPVEKYFKALEHMKGMRHYSSRLGRFVDSQSYYSISSSAGSLGAWDQLGPGNLGGRTGDLLIDPGDVNTMVAAAVGGGVWKTTNAGASWSPLDDLLPSLVVSSLAMDPANSSVIYAGTGEAVYSGIDGVQGAGILKTTNGGTSWTLLSGTTTSFFDYVNDVVVSPFNSQNIYAATKSGIARSTNGGTSWSQVLSGIDTVPDGCQQLVMRTDTSPNDYVFAACAGFDGGNVFRNVSAQSGNSWTDLTLPTSTKNLGRVSIAVAPSSQTTIYAVGARNDLESVFNFGLDGVYRSTNSGDTWSTQLLNDDDVTKLSNMLRSNPFDALCLGSGNHLLHMGLQVNAMAVDPVDANRVWIGGVDLFRSDDGGVNWGLASHWTSSPAPNYVRAGHHAILFQPGFDGNLNKTMFVAGEGGIYRTDDARAATATLNTAPCDENSGVSWADLNHGYNAMEFNHGLPYPDGTTYFGGTIGNGTVRGNDADGPDDWEEILGGEGGFVAIDPANTDNVYAENTGLSIQKSTDGGITFQSATNGINPLELGQTVNPFVMDPGNPQRLWTGSTNIWRTDDGAATWTQASDGSGAKELTAIAVSPLNPNLVIAGKASGAIISTNQALSATSTTNWLNVNVRVGVPSWIAFDPASSNVAYLTYSTFNRHGDSHIYKTTDGGAHWVGIDGSSGGKIPDIPVHCIVVNPFTPSTLYVGTDLGIFVSLDGGSNWAVENTGFANVDTETLAFTSAGGILSLFAFTRGRGAWRVDLGPAPTPPSVSITDPSPGDTVSGVISVSADASDDSGTVTKVEFYVDGVLINTDFTDPFSVQWDTTTVSNGSHSLTARAYDPDNTPGNSFAVNVTTDNPISALFEDDFDNGQIAPWTIAKGIWTESSGDLQVTTSSKATIDGPAGTACGTCQISNDLTIVTAGATLWLYGWYKDSNNYVRVELKSSKNKVTLFQKANGTTAIKTAVSATLNANQPINLTVGYSSGKFQLYLNGVQLITNQATPQVPSSQGKVTYTVKAAVVGGTKVSTTVKFNHIIITP